MPLRPPWPSPLPRFQGLALCPSRTSSLRMDPRWAASLCRREATFPPSRGCAPLRLARPQSAPVARVVLAPARSARSCPTLGPGTGGGRDPQRHEVWRLAGRQGGAEWTWPPALAPQHSCPLAPPPAGRRRRRGLLVPPRQCRPWGLHGPAPGALAQPPQPQGPPSPQPQGCAPLGLLAQEPRDEERGLPAAVGGLAAVRCLGGAQDVPGPLWALAPAVGPGVRRTPPPGSGVGRARPSDRSGRVPCRPERRAGTTRGGGARDRPGPDGGRSWLAPATPCEALCSARSLPAAASAAAGQPSSWRAAACTGASRGASAARRARSRGCGRRGSWRLAWTPPARAAVR
jgi:hypothetical protein